MFHSVNKSTAIGSLRSEKVYQKFLVLLTKFILGSNGNGNIYDHIYKSWKLVHALCDDKSHLLFSARLEMFPRSITCEKCSNKSTLRIPQLVEIHR